MLGRRYRKRIVRMALQLLQGSRLRCHHAANTVVEAFRPVEAAIAIRPVNSAKVVAGVAAAEDEHAALAQRRQPCAQIHVVRERSSCMDRQLQHRDVGGRENVCEHRPCAEAVADTLASIHRFDNDPSPPSPESRYPVLGVRVASARNTRTSSGE